MPRFIGSIDQGTTSTRFVIFNESGAIVTFHQMEFEQNFPQPGYVEHHVPHSPPFWTNTEEILVGLNTIPMIY